MAEPINLDRMISIPNVHCTPAKWASNQIKFRTRIPPRAGIFVLFVWIFFVWWILRSFCYWLGVLGVKKNLVFVVFQKWLSLCNIIALISLCRNARRLKIIIFFFYEYWVILENVLWLTHWSKWTNWQSCVDCRVHLGSGDGIEVWFKSVDCMAVAAWFCQNDGVSIWGGQMKSSLLVGCGEILELLFQWTKVVSIFSAT